MLNQYYLQYAQGQRSLELVFILSLHFILSSFARTIIPTALQLDYCVTTTVIAASNKSASLVICKTKSEYFDPRRVQLVANQSSPSRVTPHAPHAQPISNVLVSLSPRHGACNYHCNRSFQ